MLVHRQQYLGFRVTEWPFASGSFNNVFPKSKVKYDIGKLCLDVSKSLYKIRRPIVQANVFRLVNVTRPGIYSYGQTTPPPSSVVGPVYSKVLLTFALTPYLYDKHTEVSTSRHIHYNTYAWGPRHAPYSFLTMGLSLNDLNSYNIPSPFMSDMEYLYKTVGIFTKNFVRNYDWITGNVLSKRDISITYSKYMYMPVGDVFKRVPYVDWTYCRNIWINAQNYLTVKTFTPETAKLYYIMFLRDITLTSMLGVVRGSHLNSIDTFCIEGMVVIRSHIQSKTHIKKLNIQYPEIAAAYLLALDEGIVFTHDDVEGQAADYVNKLVMEESDIFKSTAAVTLTSMLLDKHLS